MNSHRKIKICIGVNAEQILSQLKMSGTADRQKFCESLDQSKNDCFKPIHVKSSNKLIINQEGDRSLKSEDRSRKSEVFSFYDSFLLTSGF
jgi:hypothetical protein